MVMAPVMPGGAHPSDEVHGGGMMMVGHSSLRSPNTHSTATLPLPTRMRSSVSYNDVLLEEPRRVTFTSDVDAHGCILLGVDRVFMRQRSGKKTSSSLL
ncbi:hypothetical protein BIW11_04783 [Tropilaelaps mercedesae]|uniref:Uncharacterized protein n=1 Tax=Tropilaelaps mercedesae TaxID=418985 RepID=A0A1V9X1H0_9ACAR|nr:hypothetical protein BIW11_04783 [Tropilaelaps mercedesae]